jgi:hypothetical protein
VSLRLLTRFALAVAVATSVQAVRAVPARATAELRAKSCCARHCRHSLGPTCAMRCCVSPSSRADVATVDRASRPDPPKALAGLLRAPADLGPREVEAPGGRVAHSPSRAGPIYLETRSLRL